MLGDPVRRGARPERLIPLDAEQEVRRDQQRRDTNGESLVEGLLLLLRLFHEADVLVDLPGRHRPPEGALRQVGDDPPRTGRLVLAVQVAAHENPRPALGRRRGGLRVGAAHLEIGDPHAVERKLLELHRCGLEVLLQNRHPLGRGGGRRRELARRVRPGRGIRAVQAGRQAFENPRDGRRDAMLAGRQRNAELGGLAAEILAIEIEAPVLLLVVDDGADLAVVDPEGQRNRIRMRGPYAAQEDFDRVLAFDRHPVHRVEGVRHAQTGDVVVERERARVAGAPALGPQAREGWLQRRWAEERHAREVVCGRQVLLHQHRRQRQHVRDVVEPVAGIVLREVVGRTHLDAEQIANRVVVFVAVETPRRHPARIGRRDAVDSGELTLEPRGNRLAPRFLRLLLLERRHLAAAQHADDVFPVIALADQRFRRLERLEVQAVLGFALVAVAAETGPRRGTAGPSR